MKYFIRAFTHFSFKGRVNRKEYGIYVLFFCLLYILSGLIDYMFDLYAYISIGLAYFRLSILQSLCYLVCALPNLSMAVKRLHDIGRSGNWVIVFITPIFSIVLQIVLL